MSIVGYQSTPQAPIIGGGTNVNTQREIALASQYINPLMIHSPGRNIIAVINDNIVIGKDIRIRSRRGQKQVAGWQISLPAPINKNQQGEHVGTLLSREGNPFYYAMDDDGRIFVSGIFKSEQDEIIFNVNPYVAELPLKLRAFRDRDPDSFDFPPDEVRPPDPDDVRDVDLRDVDVRDDDVVAFDDTIRDFEIADVDVVDADVVDGDFATEQPIPARGRRARRARGE